jgi:hypothetical protein
MEEIWASGSLELLRHADSHIQFDSAFDSRIAFISIETSIRTFISLLEKILVVKFQKKEVDEAGSSFSRTKRISDFAHLEK